MAWQLRQCIIGGLPFMSGNRGAERTSSCSTENSTSSFHIQLSIPSLRQIQPQHNASLSNHVLPAQSLTALERSHRISFGRDDSLEAPYRSLHFRLDNYYVCLYPAQDHS